MPVVAVVVVSLAQSFLFYELEIEPPWLPSAIAVTLLIGAVVVVRLGVGRFDPRLRSLAFALLASISISSFVAVVELVRQLVGNSSLTGARLLMDGGVLWFTNVVVFSLWYFELDSGGPTSRAAGEAEYPDFLFPQQTTPGIADAAWKPHYIDYFYVAFTGATAFSPTDTMPLSRWAKLMMAAQSLVSLVLAALVISRAVNVLK